MSSVKVLTVYLAVTKLNLQQQVVGVEDKTEVLKPAAPNLWAVKRYAASEEVRITGTA